MDFVTFTNLSGGKESFFAQDIKRISQLEMAQPNGERGWVTQITFGAGNVTVREPYEQVLETVVKAWAGE